MYSFVSKDIDVYELDDDNQNHFTITKLLCSKCHNYWHTSLLECYFCGELNYYLYSCTVCGKKYSITNSSVKCECKSPDSKLIKACVNSKCPSNIKSEIKELAEKQGGVFDLGSSLNLSLMYCVKCGNTSNHYETFRVFLVENNSKVSEFIKDNLVNIGDILILKNNKDQIITYDFIVIDEKDPTYPKKLRFDNMNKIIEKIFENKK
jgi:hypothetical protein